MIKQIFQGFSSQRMQFRKPFVLSLEDHETEVLPHEAHVAVSWFSQQQVISIIVISSLLHNGIDKQEMCQ